MSAAALVNLLQRGLRLWVTGGHLHYRAPQGVLTPALRQELAEHKAEVVALLEEGKSYAHLSFAQERMWLLAQLDPSNPGFNMPVAIRLIGRLDTAALTQSLGEIVRRHEALRTTFVALDGFPVQVIAPAWPVSLPVTDLRGFPEAEREAQARRLAAEEMRRPFDLTRGPLFRASLLQLGDQDHVLLLSTHHIASDGWSQIVLMREVSALYQAFADGRPSPLPELPMQYADFAQWQRQYLTGSAVERDLAYWKEQLAGPLPVLELVTERAPSAARAPAGVQHKRRFSQSLTEALKALGRQEGATLFMTLLAAFQALLYRYTGQTDIVVGSPIANRDRTEVEGMIGLFLNTLVLRTDLSGDPTFLELLGRVRQVVLEAFAHKDLPFEQLVEALHPERDLNRNPLFQVVFILQDRTTLSFEVAGLRLSPFFDNTGLEAEMPDLLGLSIQETEAGLVSFLECRAGLLNQNILGHLQTWLEGVVANPRQRLSELPLLAEAERHQLLVAWNDTRVDRPGDSSLHRLIEAQVERTPDAVAVVFEGQQLSYRELDRRANQLARHLQQVGVGPEAMVAICMERSLEMVIGLLGILKAGAVYVPLDPAYPSERLSFMLQDAQAPVLLTQARWLERSLFSLPAACRVVCLDTDWDVITQADETPLPGEAAGHRLAYAIYTSGSTGQPKGAMNTHQAICNRLLWMQEAYGLTPADRVLQKTPFSFDVSVWEFFWPLLTGACLVVARPEGHKDSAYLVDVIVKDDITTIHFVPSMLRAFVEAEGVASCRSLKRVMCSGEALPFDVQERFFERLGAELHNLYGPTEAAVDVTFWACTPGSKRRSVPIGRPIANTQIYVLDARLQPVPVGVPGELHIGGMGLARGYLNRPALTADKFIPDPFSAEPGARLYKTGDLACYWPDGAIEFLGRLDYQVKIRGFRIELGEIEAVLEQHPSVRASAVLAREDVPGDLRLVAYVVPRAGPSAPIQDIREFLRNRLPDYMVPSAFVTLEALPLTPNGKLDRRALPAPDDSGRERAKEFVAPQTPLEEKLAEMWRNILGVERVGIHDNFFDLGGHSLKATQLIYQINKTFQTRLPLPDLFEQPTIAGLALLIEEALLEELEREQEEQA